ncbi:MAG TPA: DUF1080 domain-containing protein [Tepidisphaeraceae bacterium]|jgi:hypothetical protein|nr:DUF1080 domain-containing protein [Tepidisphaeraceae bacterium]
MKYRNALMIGLLAAGSVYAADTKPPKTEEKPKKEATFTDPAKAGIDYKLQGEYEGTAGSAKWGAQVIAMGDGKFHAVFEPGGLPGDGWDAKNRYESAGELSGDAVTFKPTDKVAWEEGHFAPAVEIKKGFDAMLSGGTLTGKTDGGESFTLKKTLRRSSTEGAKPPQGAIVLFDGKNVDAWNGTKIIDGDLMKEGGETKQKFTDYTLHVEFYLPFKPSARTQGRGNSGVYNQHRYEVQVLDSFGVKGMDNQCGGIYTKNPPLVNMCYPPLTWQTYDIDFTAARYEDGKKKSDAEITVKQNGVLIQDHFKINGPTGGGQKEDPKEAIQSGPLYLQEHGNPVAYRNVWIVEKK